MIQDRRAGAFTERLSMFMLRVAAIGAGLVLLDPKWTVTLLGATINIGGDGFSADLKGAVISAILIGGWTAVKEYWLGSSAGSEKKSDTLNALAAGGQAPRPQTIEEAPPTAPDGATKGTT